MNKTIGSALLLGAMLVSWGAADFCQRSRAAAEATRQPFSNAVEQRKAIIQELREIKKLLKEQNSLLRAAEKEPQPSP